MNRGRVEDKRFEAKAKNTKKSKTKDSSYKDRPSQGQGQDCSWSKTKDTAASVFKKKKGLKINFQAISKKKPFQKFFR